MIDSFLMKAIKLELHLQDLFDSKLCTQRLEKNMTMCKFPKKYHKTTPVTHGYGNDWSTLVHDKNVYEEIFIGKQKKWRRILQYCKCKSKR